MATKWKVIKSRTQSGRVIKPEFGLTPKQQKILDKWEEEQCKKYPKEMEDAWEENCSPVGVFEYCFRRSGIGNIVKVRNVVSGDGIDLTDHYEFED